MTDKGLRSFAEADEQCSMGSLKVAGTSFSPCPIPLSYTNPRGSNGKSDGVLKLDSFNGEEYTDLNKMPTRPGVESGVASFFALNS